MSVSSLFTIQDDSSSCPTDSSHTLRAESPISIRSVSSSRMMTGEHSQSRGLDITCLEGFENSKTGHIGNFLSQLQALQQDIHNIKENTTALLQHTTPPTQQVDAAIANISSPASVPSLHHNNTSSGNHHETVNLEGNLPHEYASRESFNRLLLAAETRLLQQELTGGTIIPSLGSKEITFVNPSANGPKQHKDIISPSNLGIPSTKGSSLLSKLPKKSISSKSAGLGTHFNLPKTQITPATKRELQLLSMRNVTEPKRFYKQQGRFKIPEYSQIGTVIEGPTDHYSGRLPNKARTKSFLEEAARSEQETRRMKSKYGEIQKKHQSGKRAFYKTLLARRKRIKQITKS